MQMQLFDELPEFHGFKGEPGSHWKAGSGIAHNWRGYYRYSESGRDKGCFQIHSFGGSAHPDGSDSVAWVYMVDENGDLYTEPHHITQSDKLCILGHKFGREHWNH